MSARAASLPLLAVCLLALALGGCQAEPTRVYERPPAPVEEEPPHKPGPGYFWRDGHYEHQEGPGWFWVSGRWEQEREGQIWIPGRWRPGEDAEGRRCWVWHPSYWEVEEELHHPNR